MKYLLNNFTCAFANKEAMHTVHGRDAELLGWSVTRSESCKYRPRVPSRGGVLSPSLVKVY